MGLEEDEIVDKPHVLSRFYKGLSQRYQLFLDQWTPYTLSRWIATILLGILFMCRIVHVQGFYIVTYALGIYHLNLLIAFLTPKIDPALELESENEDGPSLPTKSNEEFRPFMRRLPEFKFWHAATKSIIIAFVCTFFEMFNVPVFWPILVVYFVILFCLTMKRQIKHMIKYRYVPFTTGKPRHAGKSVPVQSNSLVRLMGSTPSSDADDVKPLIPAQPAIIPTTIAVEPPAVPQSLMALSNCCQANASIERSLSPPLRSSFPPHLHK
ncbi:hypothetical protein M514_03799 [Trichuris suis]|uniref:Protein RER1 n=1 Tax=Trichuris suis TaxID=68888 RepID=A0A085MZP3_9BILA|nr:hypothetical protein M514_03799 [Trichuris suis]